MLDWLLEVSIFGLACCLIAFILAKIIKRLFKKDITYENFYAHAFIAGFVLRAVIYQLFI